MIKKKIDFTHQLKDLKKYDYFYEFVLGNGEMWGLFDALHSQELTSQHFSQHCQRPNTIPLSIRTVNNWQSDPPYQRSRPAGKILTYLTCDQQRIGLNDLATYHQELNIYHGKLETRYAWKIKGLKGKSFIQSFISKTDRAVMVYTFEDHVDGAEGQRHFTIQTRFPYDSRIQENIIPPLNAEIRCFNKKSEIIYQNDKNTVCWKICANFHSDQHRVNQETGELDLSWNLEAGKRKIIELIVVLYVDRSKTRAFNESERSLQDAVKKGINKLFFEQRKWWEGVWDNQGVDLPDQRLQRYYELSTYYLLISSGGTYLADVCAYERGWMAPCTYDQIINLISLYHLGHIHTAREGIKHFHKFLSLARRCGTKWVKENLGIKNKSAAFLMYFPCHEKDTPVGGVNRHGWAMAPHVALLFELEAFIDDDRYLTQYIYPWIRAYAEYAQSALEWDKKLKKYIVSGKIGLGIDEDYWMIFKNGKMRARIPVEKFADGFVDVMLIYRWLLRKAAGLAEKLGADETLRRGWKEKAEQIFIPRTKAYLLQYKNEKGTRRVKTPAELNGLFWPAKGNYLEFDRKTVLNTLHRSIRKQKKLDGSDGGYILGINHGYFGLAWSYLGEGEKVLKYLSEFEEGMDDQRVQTDEYITGPTHYYYLAHGFFNLIISQMCLQYFNERLRFFWAIPPQWKKRGIRFKQFPVCQGIQVSGEFKGKSGQLIFVRENKTLFIIRGEIEKLELTQFHYVSKIDRCFFVQTTPNQVQVSR